MTVDELRERFFDALLRRPGTKRQAREFLLKYRAPEEIIDALMAEAERAGLVDDGAFARLFADGHAHWGNLKIAHELRMRGVDSEAVDEALSEAEDEAERARELAEAWRKGGVEERKITSRLMSRGFTGKAVRAVARQRDS